MSSKIFFYYVPSGSTGGGGGGGGGLGFEGVEEGGGGLLFEGGFVLGGFGVEVGAGEAEGLGLGAGGAGAGRGQGSSASQFVLEPKSHSSIVWLIHKFPAFVNTCSFEKLASGLGGLRQYSAGGQLSKQH